MQAPAPSKNRAGPLAFSPSLPGLRALVLLAVGLATASYLTALIATVPVRGVLQLRDESGIVTDAAGTLWRGQAWLGREHRLSWHIRPWASLASAGLVWHASLDSEDTALTAQVGLQGARMRADSVDGAAGWSLMSLLGSPGMAECALAARVVSGRLTITPGAVSAEGEAVVAPSRCHTRAGERFDLPRLSLMAYPEGEMARIAVRRDDRGGGLLAELVLGSEGVAAFSLTPDGAEVFGNLP